MLSSDLASSRLISPEAQHAQLCLSEMVSSDQCSPGLLCWLVNARQAERHQHHPAAGGGLRLGAGPGEVAPGGGEHHHQAGELASALGVVRDPMSGHP